MVVLAGNMRTIDDRLLRRRCVVCGYDGALLRNGLARQCARCGCDLRQRPARSYAEMEGLVTRPDRPETPIEPLRRQEHVIHRWLAFMFLALVGFVAILYLSAATLLV